MFCWGDSSTGQLGLGDYDEKLVSSPRPMSAHFQSAVVQVAFADCHTVFLTRDSTVFCCGAIYTGQQGREVPGNHSPEFIEGLADVRSVACGKHHCLAVCGNGRVYSWGAASDQRDLRSVKPRVTDGFLNVQVIQVACGSHHSLALSTGGAVYSWGDNSYGQLGLGKSIASQRAPKPVTALCGVPLDFITAGGDHSFAVSLPGSVYGWGRNTAGQLGLGRIDAKGRFTPCLIPALSSIGVARLRCGEAHTVALTQDGNVYTFGDGCYGQLGHSSTSSERTPRRLELFDGTATQIACGSHHTLVYSATTGQLYAFGSGAKGQLGIGGTSDKLQPSPVDPVWRTPAENGSQEPQDIVIFAGMNSNFVQTSSIEGHHGIKQVMRINETKLQKWMAVTSGSEEWKEAKSEISLIFSSSSCLVASFLKSRQRSLSEQGDNSYNVDLKRARKTFTQLQRKDWIVQQMASALCDKLIPGLQGLSQMSEALEVYLLFPECSLFHEEGNVTKLVSHVAASLARMNLSSMKTLRSWWSVLQASYLNKNIQMFKSVISFSLKSHYDNFIKDALVTLKQIYKANEKAEFTVPVENFYIKEIAVVNLHYELFKWRHSAQLEDVKMEPVIFCHFPFVFDLQTKIQLFLQDSCLQKDYHWQLCAVVAMQNLAMRQVEMPPKPIFSLTVKRSNLRADAFRKLNLATNEDLRKELMVEFVGEPALDLGGVKREFFLLLFDELIQPESGLFCYNDSSTLIWFPPKSTVERKQYFLFGILCGLVMYSFNIVHLPFPLALFKKLLERKPTLEDLKDLEPSLGKSLQYLLDYIDDDFEDNFTIFFSVVWCEQEVDLVDNGKHKPVTNTNKQEFVDAYVDHILNKSVKDPFDEFKRGFIKVCDQDILGFFQPQELMDLMVGNTDYDWDVLEENTTYTGEYHKKHPTIMLFWSVFHEMNLHQRKAFLLFLTGSDRIPMAGMACIKMTILSSPHLTEDHYPEASTCFLQLMLPRYSTKERLQEKLLHAIQLNKGFGRT
ncbi:probable E3 ubiquitin-protein ligase HERC4 [Erpetoichthys calabaricus]|uniref:probable E3 ubiquitin-protein ligase HERC4 n=1 Tax=Erpetoichthys calabaricus TaxID=27687 RepID=UPI00223492EA|nr:probable E3 ubiquitin-protein ligase HERC4 [Erpetoichthys calabaricus]